MQVLAGLDVILSSETVRFLGITARNDILGVISLVQGLKDGVGPRPDVMASMSDYHKDLIKRCEKFATCEITPLGDEACLTPSKILTGRKAIEYLREDCTKKVTANGALDMDVIKLLRAFKYTLTEPQRIEVDVWFDVALMHEAAQVQKAIKDDVPVKPAPTGGCLGMFDQEFSNDLSLDPFGNPRCQQAGSSQLVELSVNVLADPLSSPPVVKVSTKKGSGVKAKKKKELVDDDVEINSFFRAKAARV